MKNQKKLEAKKNFFYTSSHSFLEYLAAGFLWKEDISPKIPFILFTLGRIQLVSILLWAQFHFTTRQQTSDILTNFVQNLVQLLSGLDLFSTVPKDDTPSLIVSFISVYMLVLCLIVVILLFRFR